MAVNKQHREFHTLDLSVGWETPPGYPAGIEQKILAGSLDETSGRGTRTRLLRFAPGCCTSAPFVHAYWEEIYVLSGDLTVAAGASDVTFGANSYACRPPGVPHGPFKSNGGCLLFEIHYYDPI